tara:strand:- start:22907 stop:23500 length:594 start_codon:yes stop_codon:yes gene_type:complete
MIKMTNTTFNESKDGLVPIAPGVYPAHVAALESKELQTKAGEQTVFNITFVIADEVSDTKVAKLIKNGDGTYHAEKDEVTGEQVTISGSFMAGKRFNSRGIWLTPSPEDGQGWRNRQYKEFFESLGVVFPKNKAGDTVLALVEESDIIGHPCFIKLQKENYERDGEQRYVWKAFDAFPWSDGETLSADEVTVDDLPF